MKYLVYALLTAIVFLLDIRAGYNYPVWVLYVLPILYALKTFKGGHFRVIVISSVLILAGFMLSPPADKQTAAILHRTFDIAAFWIIWFYLLKQKTKSEKIKSQAEYIEELAAEEKKLETALQQKTEIEKDLRRSEERFRSTFENAAVAIAHASLDGRWLMLNDKLCQITGYSREELMKKTFKEITYPEDLKADLVQVERLLRGEIQNFSMEKRYIHKNGHLVWVNLTVSLQLDTEGKPLYLIGIIQDITSKKKVEAGLLDANRKLFDTLESITDGFISLDYAWRFLYVNEQAAQFMNKSRQDLFGKVFWEAVPEAQDSPFKSIFLKSMAERVPVHGEGICPASGIWLSCRCHPSAEGISVYLENINEKKKSEDILQSSLMEKEVLLKELYHRTKNNMQVISSFLHMQFSKVPDENVRQMFNEMQNRIKGMSMVHDKLYRSKDLSRLDLGEYTRELAASILASYKGARHRVALKTDIEDIAVSIDTATPWGLILNELMSNSLKYAFPEERKGEITISIRKSGPGGISVIYADNGIGLPQGFEPSRAETLGMRLILNLVFQLDGALELENAAGARFIIRFKDSNKIGPETEKTKVEEQVNSA